MPYNGSIELISGITQKNKGTFPLMDASAVRVDDDTRLDQKLDEIDQALNDIVIEETDPTVPAWAKAATKPTYTATEVGADATGSAAQALKDAKTYTDSKVPTKTSQLTNDSNYIEAVDGKYLQKPLYYHTHPEGTGGVIPFLYNDLAFFFSRGGKMKAYTTTDTDYTQLELSTFEVCNMNGGDKLFDGSPSYCYVTLDDKTKPFIIDLTLPYVFAYSNQFYIDFGSSWWGWKNIGFYIWNDSSENTKQTYKYVSGKTSDSLSPQYFCRVDYSYKDTTGATQQGFNKIRIVLDKFNPDNPQGGRISQIGLISYGSSGQRMTGMSRGIDDPVYRSISPSTANSYDLGRTDLTWRNIYATNFNGLATKATSDANGHNIVDTYATKTALSSKVDKQNGYSLVNDILIEKISTNDSAIATLNGTGAGSISAMIDAKINAWAAQLTDDGVVNTYAEALKWIAEHGSDYTTLLGSVDNKVDKISGKGLSTNDYTTAEKDKLATIEQGAQVNPTKLSELEDDILSGQYLPITGGTITGKIISPKIETGTGNDNYFQSRKFRGEGDANTYYHAIDYGYASHNQVDFYEYGGIWNFWKNTTAAATTAAENLALKITLSGLQNKNFSYTWPNKTGTFALTSDIPTKVSTLTNDAGYLTSHQSLENYVTKDAIVDFAVKTDIPTKLSELTNDTGFLIEHQDLSAYAKKTEIPTTTADLRNTSGYITENDVQSYVESMAKVAKTGSYNDLTDKPEIPDYVPYDDTELRQLIADKQVDGTSGLYVSYTKNSANVVGNTKDVAKITPEAIFVPKGIIMGGSAKDAGLVTRGICGIGMPNESTGACTKENLYVNYDGDNNFNSNRQIVVNAGTIGQHLGNNMYQYTLPRGEIVKKWVEAQGYLKSFTETDPTVPEWAKASTKPTYTCEEVGADAAGAAAQALVDAKVYTDNMLNGYAPQWEEILTWMSAMNDLMNYTVMNPIDFTTEWEEGE